MKPLKPLLQYRYNKNGYKETFWCDVDGNEYSTVEACRALFDDEDVIGLRIKKKRRQLLLLISKI